MATFAYPIGDLNMRNGTIDVDNDTIKMTLLMTNTTADTEQDADDVDDFTTLDECDAGGAFTWGHGGNGRKTVTITATRSAGQTQINIPAGSTTWLSLPLGGSGRSIAGALLFSEGSADDTDAYPIAWLEFTSPVAANGTDFTITWSGGEVVVANM
jgi:hypothetical protein